MTINIRPLGDRLIVERMEEARTTKGGIVIPDSAAEKSSKGTVLAIGPGKRSDDGKVHPLAVKVGDKVWFGKYAGTEIKQDGKELVFLREDDVMGVIEG